MNYIDHLMSHNEKTVVVTHQHWMVLISSVLVNLALSALIAAVAYIVTTVLLYPFGYLTALLILVPLARLVHEYLKWSNQEYIITNRRVIQVEGIVNKNVTDSSLEKVNDVKMSQSFLGRLLDYGDVEILTASELGANLFKRIMSPVKFKTAMLDEKAALESGASVERPASGEPAEVDVPTMITALDQLRKQGLITEEEFQQKKAQLLAKM